MTPLDFGRDINGFNAFAPRFSDTCKEMQLAADTEQHFTVPNVTDTLSGKRIVAIFSIEPGATVFVANNATAVAFSGAAGDTTTVMNPTSRTVNPGDVLSFITKDTAAYVGVEFHATS